MNVWLITTGEPLPTDDGCDRFLRTAILADLMARNGHEVTSWSSTSDHVKKSQRFATDTEIVLRGNYRLKLLHAAGYRQNISLRRVWNHRGVARKFREQAARAKRPDVILCSLPTLELCVEATRYGRRHQVPVVLDVRDLWPDLFLDVVPPAVRPVARLLATPFYRQVREACAQADAITGTTDEYVRWALAFSGRRATHDDRPFAMGYVASQPPTRQQHAAQDFWAGHGIRADSGQFVACWFGMMGRHSELDTLIAAAKRLGDEFPQLRVVLCGAGPNRARLNRLAADCSNVVLPGWVNADQIWQLMRLSSVGLTPYVSNKNYIHNLTNKPVEYLSAGLPILSSLQGVLARLLNENDCGVTYRNRDVDQLITAIRSLANDQERLSQMSNNATQLYREQFVAERVYTRMQDYLVDLASKATVGNKAA
ncbi:MAG: glycosyltransferase family 4 protein [Planctomycetaceae bacterium]